MGESSAIPDVPAEVGPRLRRLRRRRGMTLTAVSVRAGISKSTLSRLESGQRKLSLELLRAHAGYEWLYVLSGEMRLIVGEHDITMGPGEVAEFDTRLPHWFGPIGDEPVEVLSVHGSQGQRMHVRAVSRDTRPTV